MFVLQVTCKAFFQFFYNNWSKSRICMSLWKSFCFQNTKFQQQSGWLKFQKFQLSTDEKNNFKWFHFFLTLKDKKLGIKMHRAVCLKRMCFPVTAFSLLPIFLCLPAASAPTATRVPVRWWNRIQIMNKGRFIQLLYKHTYWYSPESQQ